jgi:hypothetical protein
MTEGQLSTLDARALSERLRALAGEERNVQADFLVHLDALDGRRGYAELGYPSLWEYCLRALNLREGAAGRRIGAMRVLRRFPSLVDAVREGRLCLSTLCALGPVLTPENVEEVTARAAFRTKAETDAIAASVRPRPAPANGIRRLPTLQPAIQPSTTMLLGPAAAVASVAQVGPEERETSSGVAVREAASDLALRVASSSGAARGPANIDGLVGPAEEAQPLRLEAPPPPRRPVAELLAVAEAQWSLRVTLDSEAKRDLETLTHLLGHKVPDGNLAAVLKEALRCAVEKHGVRRGALVPVRKRPPPERHSSDPSAAPCSPGRLERGEPGGREKSGDSLPASSSGSTEPSTSPAPRPTSPIGRSSSAVRPTIPAEVRRQIWTRDGGRCSFTGPDGTRCDSRFKLELDHIVPWAIGGSPTVDNLRLRCRAHNLLHAERVFGREHMDRYRRGGGDPRSASGASSGCGA